MNGVYVWRAAGRVGSSPRPTRAPRRVLLGPQLFLKKHQWGKEGLVRFKVIFACFFSIYFFVFFF